jgi:hypothetical protein
MATIDTHRASYNRPNITIGGKKDNLSLSPTVTEEKRVSYSVRIGEKIRHCTTISQVNAIQLSVRHTRESVELLKP